MLHRLKCVDRFVCDKGRKKIGTFGAGIARVKVHYTSLPDFIRSLGEDIPVFGTFLNGKNMYEQPLTANGCS